MIKSQSFYNEAQYSYFAVAERAQHTANNKKKNYKLRKKKY